MKLVKRFIVLPLLLITMAGAHAQISLSITKVTATPDTVALGTNFSFVTSIKNTDTAAFVGRIRLQYSINGALQPMDSVSGLAYDTAISISTLQSFDSVLRTITVNVTNPRFQTGPSVVVIWPIASTAFAEDSVILNLDIFLPSGIPVVEHEPVHAYTVGDQMFIDTDSFVTLKQVRVFDITGRAVLNKLNPSTRIPLPETNHSIYVAEIIYNNNQRKIFKFFR